MKQPVKRIAAALLAFVLLSAGDCGGLSFSDIVTGHSALITVKNNSSQTVTVLLYADDASNTGAVIANGSATITTHIDGAYHVIVVGQGEKLTNWDSSLRGLRTATEDLYVAIRSGQPPDLGAATQRILRAKAALAEMQAANVTLASCIGPIKFATELVPSPRPVEIEATFTRAASGAWSASCPGT